jgi:hypothetical protein
VPVAEDLGNDVLEHRILYRYSPAAPM